MEKWTKTCDRVELKNVETRTERAGGIESNSTLDERFGGCLVLDHPEPKEEARFWFLAHRSSVERAKSRFPNEPH